MPTQLSRAYLEEALKAVKTLLPGWQYAVIRQAALPRSGARGRYDEKPPASMLQSLIFDKERFTSDEAKAWAKEHGFSFGGLDETSNTFRLRQENPGQFSQMRTIDITDGIKAVLGFKGSEKQAIAKASAIVGLFLPPEVAQAIALPGGEPPGELHITLAHLGDASLLSAGAHELVVRVLSEALSQQPPLAGVLSGVGRFDPQEGVPEPENVYYASVDMPGLVELRAKVVEALASIGVRVSEVHGFDPHITLAYAPSGLEVELPEVDRLPLRFDSVGLALGPVRLSVPFGVEAPRLDEAAGWLVEASHLVQQVKAGEAEPNPEVCGRVLAALFGATRALLGEAGAVEAEKAYQPSAYVNDLPDEAFLLVAPGGEKDETGRTTPRGLRALPFRDAEGTVSLPLVRSAMVRLSQATGLPEEEQKRIQEEVSRLLAETKKGQVPLPWLEPIQDCAACQAKNGGACAPDLEKGCRFCKTSLPPGSLGTQGQPGASILFVGAAPRPIDVARGEALTGSAGAAFRDEYLTRLGLTKTDVAITHLVPEARKYGEPEKEDIKKWGAWVRREIHRIKPRTVVALGNLAKRSLGDLADFALPHPSAIQKGDTRGEVERKLRMVQKRLTEASSGATPLDRQRESSSPIQSGSDPSPSRSPTDTQGSSDEEDGRQVRIAKADREKQVVYGVVLDPYTVDTQNDWAPPAEIEEAAHRWLSDSRVVGLNHGGVAKAHAVESFMVPYPSPEDYQKAMTNQMHKALRIQLGDQKVGSGAWVLGVKVDDPVLWSDVASGRLDAFSIGGYSERKNTKRAAMPRVEFINA